MMTRIPASIPKYFVGTKLEKPKIKNPADTIMDVDNIGKLIDLYTNLILSIAVKVLSFK